MILWRAPSPSQMDRFVRKCSATGFNTPLGLTNGAAPARWFVDDVDAILGVGPEAFAAASDAMRSWAEMDLPWFRVHRPGSIPLEPGVVVAYAIRVAGLWMPFACRIVSVTDETGPDGSRRFGFVYATIGSHAAQGEERFLVTFDPRSGEVHGSIRAVSRPGRWFVWLGLPVARRAQRLFKPEALAALAASVRQRLAQDRSTRPR